MTIEQEYVARGTELRVARVRASLTLGKAAGQCGVSESHLSRIERGQRRVARPVAQALCGLYGVSLRAIFRSARNVELVPERGR